MSEKRQDSPPEGGSSPPRNLGLKTQDSQSWGMTRDCTQCANVTAAWNGPADLLLCANHPDHAGQLTVVACGGVGVGDAGTRCRSFRRRREPVAVRPPATPNDQVRYIDLTGGFFAIVDAADYNWLSKYNWRASGGNSSYVCSTVNSKQVYMHRLIMNPPAGMVVDHINGSPWDNRRDNLRVCTQAENLRNSRKFRGTSGFKGVFWSTRDRKWAARIHRNGRTTRLGLFDDEIEAAKAYDRAAVRLFGQYACLNFPDPRSIVWLSGRVCAGSHIRGRIVTAVHHNMPTRSVGMAPGLCDSERGQGIGAPMEGMSRSGPDVSTTLRVACPELAEGTGSERSRGARHDKRARPDNDIRARHVRWRALAASRGPPGY